MGANDQYEEVQRLWFFEDYSTRKIAPLVGLEKTRVAEIIQRYKEKDPTIAEIKTSFQRMKEDGVDAHDITRISSFKRRLDKLDFPTEKLFDCLRLLEGFGDNSLDAMNGGLKLHALESSTGKSYSTIVSEYSVMSTSLKKMRIEQNDLNGKIEKLKNQLPDLQALSDLRNKLIALGVTTARVDSFVSKHEKLEELGFTESTAEILATQLASFKATPKEASEKLTKILERYESLAKAIADKESYLKSIRKTVETQEGIVTGWKKKIEKVNEGFTKLNDSLSTDFKKTEEKYDLKTKELEKKLNGLEEQIKAAERKSIEMSDKLNFANAFTTLVQDPAHLTVGHIDLLIKIFQEIKTDMEMGFRNASDFEAQRAKRELVKGLIEIAKADIVQKTQFDDLNRRYGKLVEENKKNKADLDGAIAKSGELKSSQNDSAYVNAGNRMRDEIVREITAIMSGIQPVESIVKVLYKCPNCRRGRLPQSLNTSNFTGTFTFNCPHCEKSSSPTLLDLYTTTMKLRMGMDAAPR